MLQQPTKKRKGSEMDFLNQKHDYRVVGVDTIVDKVVQLSTHNALSHNYSRSNRENDAGGPGEVFAVRGASLNMVNGRYRRRDPALEKVDGCYIYTCEVDDNYRIFRSKGVWCLQHTASQSNMYECHRGTDTPPTHGWVATDFGVEPAPTMACLTPPTHNPLFLNLALEELVAVDKYYEVSDRIAAISSCGSVTTLLQLIFDRLEVIHAEEIIGTVLSQVAFSRGGMMESELCKIAGVPGSDGNFAWTYIFNAVAPLLTNKGGCFTMLHAEVREAVYARYMSTPGLKWAAASMQYSYFNKITSMVNLSNTFKAQPFKTRRKIVDRACFELDCRERFIESQVRNV